MKFLHIADVHLGMTPDKGFPWSAKREKEIWESFESVIRLAGDTGTELLLIAGDLFHGQPLRRELKEVAYLFGQIPDTTVVLIAGNHDYLKKDSNYLKVFWPKNVAGLWDKNCQVCYLEKLNTYVYGLSYTARENPDSVYNELFPGGRQNLMTDHPGASHILLAHGGDERHIPIRFQELARTDFDYIALGHIHKPEIIQPGKMAYAGSLEPLDKNHLGERGYIRGTIENGKTDFSFVPAAKREYRELCAEVTPDSTGRSVRDNLASAVNTAGKEHIYRILLQGMKSPEMVFGEEVYQNLGNVVEVEDNTAPDYDFLNLEKQYAGTVIGAYIEAFKPLAALDQVRRKALYYGVQALLEARE